MSPAQHANRKSWNCLVGAGHSHCTGTHRRPVSFTAVHGPVSSLQLSPTISHFSVSLHSGIGLVPLSLPLSHSSLESFVRSLFFVASAFATHAMDKLGYDYAIVM